MISGNNFNTSHVTVYRMESLSLTIPSTKFQYISCYGLSSLASYDVALNPDFNTSHVTVYLRRTMDRQYSSCISIHLMLRFIRYTGFPFPSLRIFQYISCYGLSYLKIGVCTKIVLFQYISCYGLSNDFKPFLSWHLSSFPLFYVISAFFTSRL